jgi:CcmD family protein
MNWNTRHTMRASLLVCALVLGVLAAVPVTVAAQGSQPPAAQGKPANPQDEFVPVKNLPAQEKLPAAPLLIGAYAFVWAVLLVYVWTVWRRLMKVEREVHDLNARLSTRPGRG